MNAVTLPPELQRFATEAIASGRYRDMAELLATSVSLLQRTEQARAAFVASFDAAIAEGEQNGFFSIEEIERDMDAAIEDVLSARR